MSEKRYREDLEGAAASMPAALVPGRMPASAKLFPGAMLMRKARDASGVADGADDAVARASSSSGAALPGDVRDRFESSLGADLSGVRVHTGASSAEAASSVGARAYTIGNDIHFAAGQYAPSDPFGLHLLAHEVAHTQQQAGGSPVRQNKLEVSSAGDAAEVEADRAADAMVAGARASIGVGGAGIQRKEEEESESGGSSASFTLGDRTTTYGVSKDGKTETLTHSRGWEKELFGPHQVAAEPPLFLTISIGGKATAGAETKSDDKGAVESNSLMGSLSIEVSGKLLLGAAKEKLGKAGLEGAITGSITAPVKVTLMADGTLKLPKDVVMPLLVEVTLALVAEVGDGKKKIGGALTKNLSSLKAGTLTISDSGIHFEHCSMEALAQAGKDLLWNTAETVLPGGPLIQQYEEDKKQEKKFLENSEKQDKEAEADLSRRIGADANEAAEAQIQRRMDATAGMKRNDAGSYQRDLTDEEMQPKYAEMRAAIAARGPQAEAKIQKARADAQQAMGTCNRLTSGGSWDAVKPAAKTLYNDGYKSFASGQACEQQAKEYAAANDKRLLRYFDVMDTARDSYDQAANSFRAGNAAQG